MWYHFCGSSVELSAWLNWRFLQPEDRAFKSYAQQFIRTAWRVTLWDGPPNSSSIRSAVCLQMRWYCPTHQSRARKIHKFSGGWPKFIRPVEARYELAHQIWVKSDQRLTCKCAETAQPIRDQEASGIQQKFANQGRLVTCCPTKSELNPISALSANARKVLTNSDGKKRR